jgi:hypothetical protein
MAALVVHRLASKLNAPWLLAVYRSRKQKKILQSGTAVYLMLLINVINQ